jgi:hypothetical protein
MARLSGSAQGKTGARVTIPVGEPLKALLDKTKKRAVTILTTADGNSWTESGFRASWRTACKRAGIQGLTFHDLRGTAVTRLALADCSEAEIATLTGHSMNDVGATLDAHYLKHDGGLAVAAVRKREVHEAGTKTPNQAPNWPVGVRSANRKKAQQNPVVAEVRYRRSPRRNEALKFTLELRGK